LDPLLVVQQLILHTKAPHHLLQCKDKGIPYMVYRLKTHFYQGKPNQEAEELVGNIINRNRNVGANPIAVANNQTIFISPNHPE